jgi:hypothetical protein
MGIRASRSYSYVKDTVRQLFYLIIIIINYTSEILLVLFGSYIVISSSRIKNFCIERQIIRSYRILIVFFVFYTDPSYSTYPNLCRNIRSFVSYFIHNMQAVLSAQQAAVSTLLLVFCKYWYQQPLHRPHLHVSQQLVYRHAAATCNCCDKDNGLYIVD